MVALGACGSGLCVGFSEPAISMDCGLIRPSLFLVSTGETAPAGLYIPAVCLSTSLGVRRA